MTCAASKPRATRSLVAHTDGAVLVLALFASSLLIGLLFYVLGVGRAIRHGETLRDAADAAAFSAAAMSAKGMNLMALMNMVKVSVVAVAVALQAVALGALQTIAWIKSDWWRRLVYGWTIPFLVSIQVKALTTYTKNHDTYASTLRAAHDVQMALRDELPEIAQARATDMASAFENVSGAFLAPIRSLPTEDESQDNFCARVFPFATGITHRAFEGVPMGAVKDRARSFARDNVPMLCRLSGVTSQQLVADATMGSEAFAVRAYAYGDALRANEEQGVRVALWRRDEDGGNTARLRGALSRMSLAQAEFYFEGDGEPMWNMRWRARFRRFTAKDNFAAFARACPRHLSGDCGTLSSALQAAQELILH